MAILAHDEIIKRIDKGIIKIEPFNIGRVGPASIDLTLDHKFRIYKNFHNVLQLDSDKFDTDSYSEPITVKESIRLQPGQTILGVTAEKLTLPSNICGWIQGRSRFARIGLMVHISSSFIQPGASNQQVLEIFNAGPISIKLYSGIAICQIILEETLGKASYTGNFQGQTKP